MINKRNVIRLTMRAEVIQFRQFESAESIVPENRRLETIEERVTKLGDTVHEVRGAVANLLKRVEPNEKQHVPWWAKAIISICAAGFIGFVGWTADQTVSLEGKVSALETSVGDIKSTLEIIKTPEQLKRMSLAPVTKESLSETQEAIETATKKRLYVDPDAVKALGNKLIQTASQNSQLSPVAWQAAVHLLDYRSVLNDSLPRPDTSEAVPVPQADVPAVYLLPAIKGEPKAPVLLMFGNVAREEMAVLEPSGMSVSRRPMRGPAFLVVEGGVTALDGMIVKNVIFRDCHLYYDGARPFNLANVYFVNCTFTIAQVPSGQEFARDLLSNFPTTFKGLGT